VSAFLDERYFDWLYRQVCSVKTRNPSRTYKNLLYILYTNQFVWLIPNDDNRAEDGKYLRYEFLEDEGIDLQRRDDYWMQQAPSFLEFLVALVRRLEFSTERDVSSWFMELLDNLDLKQFNDRTPIDRNYVEAVLERVNWRTYEYNGGGGLFPLVYPERDQREVEIWYQLNSYILERSPV
jgi:hypothetical protein